MRSVLTGGKATIPDPEWEFIPGAGSGGYYKDLKTGETQSDMPFGYHMCVECTNSFAIKCVKAKLLCRRCMWSHGGSHSCRARVCCVLPVWPLRLTDIASSVTTATVLPAT